MYLWLGLAALAALAIGQETIIEGDEQHPVFRVLNTWHPSRPMRIRDHRVEDRMEDHEEMWEHEFSQHHNRSKRSLPFSQASSSYGIGKVCDPGMTGQFCTVPLCFEPNRKVPDVPATSGQGAPIDGAQLANCTQPYVILVDEMMMNTIIIEIRSEYDVNPQFNLMSPDGNQVSPSDIMLQTRQQYQVMYFYLPAGQYTLIPSADVQKYSCNIAVNAKTELTISGGFTFGGQYLRSDYPSQYAHVGMKSSLVLHANRLYGAGSVQAVSFVGEDNSMMMPKLLSKRFNCSYEYYTDDVTCDVVGTYYYQVEGVTFAGYPFRRIVPFTCYPAPVTTTTPAPSTTSPRPITRCKNGGVLVRNRDSSSYCYCEGLYTGDDCSQILCLNGGTVTKDNTCMCPDSYTNTHCQDIFCQDDAGYGFDANSPTLILVIRTRQQLNDVITQVISATDNIVDTLAFDPKYLASYILVLFNNNKLLNSKRYTSYEDMRGDLIKGESAGHNDGGCSDSVYSAISSALNLYPNNKSPMYVITDAVPNDLSESNTVLAQLSFWRVPISFVFIPSDPASGCVLSPEDASYRAMDRMAKKSGGMVFYINNRTQVGTLLLEHMNSTIYRSQMLLSNDMDVCNSQNLYKSISIDISVQQLVIIATGSNLHLVLTAPDGTHPDATPIYNDGTNYIWIRNGAETGNWFVSFVAMSDYTGPCNFKVFQKSYNSFRLNEEQNDLFWAFTGGIDGDGELVQPVVGFDAAITAHLTNYPPNEVAHAAMTIYASRDGKQTEVYASNGIWRDGCTYNFYFPPFYCRVPDETLYFNFFARDNLGAAIQRAGVMSCMQFHPTPFPPSECQNGGVMNPANTTCFCPPMYTGTHCSQIVCFNGGTPMGDYCNCPIGWAGQFCAISQCVEKGPEPEFLRNFVDMVFAVELTSQGHAQIASLNTNFQDLIRDIQYQDETWIQRYVLVGFNSTWGDVLHVSPAWNPSGIINELQKLANTVPTDTGCTVQLYEALDKALRKRAVAPGSFVQIFQTSPANEADFRGWSELYEFSRVEQLVINGFLAFSPINKPNGFYCNATQDNFQLLFDLSGGSTGTVYPTQPGLVEDIIRVIPLQYSAGTVYAQWQMDCSVPMQVYFPVDAYAQTVQLDVVGLQSQIQVYNTNGASVETFNLLHDGFSNWDIYEIRKPCDDMWKEFGQSCLRYVSEKMSFPEAKDFCSKSGGHLVDDMTDAKHSYLQTTGSQWPFWIGLYNNQSGYMWDRGPRLQPLPLSNGTNQYWVGGGATPAYDPTKQCTFWDNTRPDKYTWTPDSCSTPRQFVCQKHRYDQDYAPNTLDEDVLPPGKWSVNVTTKSNGTYGGCWVQVRVQSSLQITTGFSTSMVADFPAPDPVADSPNNMMITYVHSKDNDHRTPILTHALLWDAYNGTFYNAAQYTYRLGCSWPWMTQNFACPNGGQTMNEFGIAHIGEDEFGNTFQRVTFGHCSPEVLTCGKGGIRVNGTCLCDEYYTGKYCTVPICVNNGTVDKTESYCSCPHGFAGPNCQYDQCLPRRPYNFNLGGRTLLLVVEATQQNTEAFSQLANNFASVIQAATAKDPKWFYNYALVTFNSTSVQFSYFLYTDAMSVQMALTNQLAQITDPGSCTTNIFGALTNALRNSDMITIPESQVLLVTASGAADYTERSETEEHLAYSEAVMHWLYMTSDKCGAQPSDPSLPHLVRIAYSSNGNALFISPPNVATFLTAYLPTRYQAAVLTNPTVHDNFTCAAGSWLVEVDTNTTSIYVSSSSMFGSISCKDPKNQIHTPQQMYNNDQTKLYRIDTTGLTGIYTIGLSSPGACYASIYSVGGVQVFTYFAATTASDPTAAHIDGTMKIPDVVDNNVAMFHLEGAQPGYSGQLQYVEILDVNQHKLIARSELYRREGCSWEYYSDPFRCQSDMLALFVYGMDVNYQQFRRQQVAYCINGTITTNAPPTATPRVTVAASTKTTTGSVVTSTSTASTAPPQSTTSPMATPVASTSTANGAITTATPTGAAPTTSSGTLSLQFDAVFLIDVSKSATLLYGDMSNFIYSLMNSYSVGLDYARVGLIPVLGDGSLGPMTAAGFSTITSNDLLLQYLAQIQSAYADFDDRGQFLQQALGVASDSSYTSTSNGYRLTLSNHLLVYVTATSTFSDTPSTASILSSNQYGVITVGYGAGVDNVTSMATLAGGTDCSFYAKDAFSLMTTIPQLQNLIWKANSNGGKYCGN